MPDYAAEFNLSVTRALRDQLADRLAALSLAPLTENTVLSVEARGGVYQLFLADRLVYVGKSTSNLRSRLMQHLRKLSGRQGGVAARVAFNCVYVSEDLDAMAPEKMLIGVFRKEGLAEWNTNGFGNKDPGKNRDLSLVEEGHFDSKYPIDLSLVVTLTTRPLDDVGEVLAALKKQLPYNFRYQNDADAKALFSSLRLGNDDGADESRSVSDWMIWVASRFPSSWAIVALPGYLIAYDRSNVASFASRTGSWTQQDGLVEFLPHQPAFSQAEVSVDEDLG